MNKYNKELRQITVDDLSSKTSLKEKMQYCLRFASLAPSVHNVQPWKIIIKGDVCEIYLDEDVRLPFSDSSSRNLYISCGCFLENLILVGKYTGIIKEVALFPEAENNCIARVNFGEGKVNKEFEYLVSAITKRKNIRGPFSGEPITEEQMKTLKDSVKVNSSEVLFVVSSEKIEKLASLTAHGMRDAHRDGNFRKEMSGWLINNYSKKGAGIPGFSMNMPGPLSLLLPLLLGNFNLGSILSKLNYLSIKTSPLVTVFSSKNEKTGWVDVGRQAERIMLASAYLGLSTSIYVASVEMGDLFKQVQEICEVEERPQFLLCVGKMNRNPDWFTPRLSIEEKQV